MKKLCKALQVSIAVPFFVSGMDALLIPIPHRERAAKLYKLAQNFNVPTPNTQLTDITTRATGASMALSAGSLAVNHYPVQSLQLIVALQMPVLLANNPFWEQTGVQRTQTIKQLLTGLSTTLGAYALVRIINSRSANA